LSGHGRPHGCFAEGRILANAEQGFAKQNGIVATRHLFAKYIHTTRSTLMRHNVAQEGIFSPGQEKNSQFYDTIVVTIGVKNHCIYVARRRVLFFLGRRSARQTVFTAGEVTIPWMSFDKQAGSR
jgi:hypothetical protein